ncbi:hypothetical protein, partial [Pseudogemmobacter sonorensis]|uniref:hypothetical protein n=1 Tax=Pseudogemmobacter sonorensis TaxID=2989681 RepID=UPI00369C81AB
MSKQSLSVKVEFYDQARYDEWLASQPDFSRITTFWADNLPGLTALPDLPAVTTFRAYNLPGLTALPDLPAVTT